MKKSVFLLIFLSLFFSQLILAQTQDTIVEEQKKMGSLGDVQEKSNEFLSKNLTIPQGKTIRLLFNMKPEETLTTEKIMVMVCIFIGLIILLQSILVITPFFEGSKSWLGAIVITLLIGISGAINELVIFLFKFANVFNVLEKWRPLAVVFAILITFAFFYGINKITKTMKKKIEIENAENLLITARTELKKLGGK